MKPDPLDDLLRSYPKPRFSCLSLTALIPAVLFLAGCASETPGVVSAESDPANPLAPPGKLSMAEMPADTPYGQLQAAPMPGPPGADSGAEERRGMAMPMGNNANGAPGETGGMDMGKMSEPPKAGTGEAALGGKTVYTCPMHPDVISGQPGQCPKCGMTLIKKVQSGVSPESQ